MLQAFTQLSVFLLCISTNGGSQGLKTNSIDSIVARIVKENRLMGEGVGEGGMRPLQYEHFSDLVQTATKDQMLALTDHSNAVVRCYSYWALMKDSTIDILPILVRHISDNEKVNSMFGCIKRRISVIDFMVERLIVYNTEDKLIDRLNTQQRRTLDSLIIHTPNKIRSRKESIRRWYEKNTSSVTEDQGSNCFDSYYVKNHPGIRYQCREQLHDYSGNWDFDGDGKKDGLLFIGNGGAHQYYYLRIILTSDGSIHNFDYLATDMPVLPAGSSPGVGYDPVKEGAFFHVIGIDKQRTMKVFIRLDQQTTAANTRQLRKNGLRTGSVLLYFQSGKAILTDFTASRAD